ncbi:helix-turn-helix transcriptional regulator [Aldersonia kunmingensis]|uniref:helix-turn-helix transcriptional regulator n=1 Tax=Aldersonia kunmingensis TaxID=408066 RepID=UPI000830B9A4|nr:transcriptional regulator [Aldersonia kunmingensis]
MTDLARPDEHGSIQAVAALAEDLRYRLYGYAQTAPGPVSREDAAEAVGISRKLAAFHLDKLVDVGLLRYRFHRAGAARVGRRPKMYEPADIDVQVSLPARRHAVLADILTEAVLTEDEHGSAKAAAERAAHKRGLAAATTERERLRPGRLGSERALTVAGELLSSCGFEPERTDSSVIRLRNCPFHPIAQSAPELVCRLNHTFMQGLIEGLQATTVEAALAPATGRCCVELRAITATS